MIRKQSPKPLPVLLASAHPWVYSEAGFASVSVFTAETTGPEGDCGAVTDAEPLTETSQRKKQGTTQINMST